MPDVIIRISMDTASKADLVGMTSDAVSRALSRAASRIEAYAKSIVPVRTGRLRDSVIVSPTMKSVHMIWNPVDPENAYHYAKVVDEGRPGGIPIFAKPGGAMHFFWRGMEMFAKKVIQGPMTPARFSDHMRIVVPQFVREAIIEELGMVVP